MARACALNTDGTACVVATGDCTFAAAIELASCAGDDDGCGDPCADDYDADASWILRLGTLCRM